MRKIRVLVVDDSALIRKILNEVLTKAGDFEVVATASDPFQARDLLVELKPDVMTLDIDMPKMDGLTFIEKVMAHFPTPTVILSSSAAHGSVNALRALELGAVDVVAKPSFEMLKKPGVLDEILLSKIRNAARANIKYTKNIVKPNSQSTKSIELNSGVHMIAIASSTGGTEALKSVFDRLPSQFPPIVVVQHMPAGFTKVYADNLNNRYPFTVVEAKHGERLMPNKVFIAPGDFHMEVRKISSLYQIKLHQEPALHSVRPAADYLMCSVAKFAGAHAIGVILTGMGKDGAKGLLEMKNKGAFTIGQSESSCVVYGMPAAAAALGATCQVCDLDSIGGLLVKKLSAPQRQIA